MNVNTKIWFVFTKSCTMTKTSKHLSSSTACQQPASASKQKKCSRRPKAPSKTAKNAILKSIAEEICSHVEKAEEACKSTNGIAIMVLWEFQESQPWLTHNHYSHYIKCNKPPQMITINTRELQQISSIESAQNTASSSDTQKKKKTRGRPKGSTNNSLAASASQIAMAKNHAALEFDKLKSESHKMKKRVRKERMTKFW